MVSPRSRFLCRPSQTRLAQFFWRDEVFGDDRFVDVFFDDRRRGEEDRRNFGLPVFDHLRFFFGFHFTGFTEGDRHFGGGLGLRFDRLENGHDLFAGEDALQPRDGRVLTGDRLFFRVDARAFHCRDGTAAGFVVRGIDGGEAFLAESGDRLVRLLLGVFSRPAGGVVFLGDLDTVFFEHFVRTALEERGVRIGRVTVDLDDRALRLADFLQLFDQFFGLLFTDPFVVERDVGTDFAVFDQAVVADRRHFLGVSFFDDDRGGFRVHRVDDEHFGSLGQSGFALAGLFFGVTAGVVV